MVREECQYCGCGDKDLVSCVYCDNIFCWCHIDETDPHVYACIVCLSEGADAEEENKNVHPL